MNLIEKLKLKRKLEPETFYQQLAKDGLLEGYLARFLNDKYSSDPVFRDEMLEMLQRYSTSPVKEVEHYYLEKMIESLSYFLEYTDQWRNPEL